MLWPFRVLTTSFCIFLLLFFFSKKKKSMFPLVVCSVRVFLKAPLREGDSDFAGEVTVALKETLG